MHVAPVCHDDSAHGRQTGTVVQEVSHGGNDAAHTQYLCTVALAAAGAGPGGGGKISVYSGRMLTKGDGSLPLQDALLTSFAVKGGTGVFVAAADMNRDGKAELIIGFDKARTVSIYAGLKGTLISKRDLGPACRTGVRVAARAGQVMGASAEGISPTIQLYAYAFAEGGGEGVWTARSTLANEKISGFTKSNTRGLYVG